MVPVSCVTAFIPSPATTDEYKLKETIDLLDTTARTLDQQRSTMGSKKKDVYDTKHACANFILMKSFGVQAGWCGERPTLCALHAALGSLCQ
jgi:hypothetical protein